MKPALWSRGNLEVRDASLHDICVLKHRMRAEDCAEIMASHQQTPEQALLDGFMKSEFCLTGTWYSLPICMFGVVPYRGPEIKGAGTVWLLSGDGVDNAQTGFARLSLIAIGYFLQKYSVLFNFVDARYTKSVRWIKWMGGNVRPAQAVGITGENFHFFTIERGG